MRLHGQRDGHARRTARPSEVASGRLRDELRRDVAELRVRLEELALRSEVHQVTGNEDGLEATIVEQRQMLHAFERQIRHRIADAIVEREAEVVLSGAVMDLRRAGADTGSFGPAPARAPGRVAAFSRTVAAATAAALATMFMLSSGTTGLDPASAPSTGVLPTATAADDHAEPTTATSRDRTERDPFVVAGDDATTPSLTLRERIQRRLNAAPDAPQDEAQFFEQFLTRLFGAVASVTTTTLARPADALDPTDLATGGLEARVEEIVEDAFDGVADRTDDASSDDAGGAGSEATDQASASQETESDTDVADDGTVSEDTSEPEGDDPDDTSTEWDGFGGFNGSTERGSNSTGSGSGLLNWG